MPFPYYGAKHGLARFYPRPTRDTIIEPFAGAAGYASYWSRLPSIKRVLLIDADEYIVTLWKRLMTMTADEVAQTIYTAIAKERLTEPLIGFVGGGNTIADITAGRDRQVTPRMRTDAPMIIRRIQRTLPYLYKFDIVHGTYADAPDIEATWFIDPPYEPHITANAAQATRTAGNVYNYSAAAIDFTTLGNWCQQRTGQIIVCEQQPAAWLPFVPFRAQFNGSNRPSERIEVIWHRCDMTPEQLGLDL